MKVRVGHWFVGRSTTRLLTRLEFLAQLKNVKGVAERQRGFMALRLHTGECLELLALSTI